MQRLLLVVIVLLSAGFLPQLADAQDGTTIPLIDDVNFQRGFITWKPLAKMKVPNGQLKSPAKLDEPAWGIAQWHSRFDLAQASRKEVSPGVIRYDDGAKSVEFDYSNPAAQTITLGLDGTTEYGGKPPARGAAWPHLLIERKLLAQPSLSSLASVPFRLSYQLIQAEPHREEGWDAQRHTAQFVFYLTIVNQNPQSKGYRDMLWFGIPIYDLRYRETPQREAKDFSTAQKKGTGKFIFTPASKEFTEQSAADGEWITIEKNLLPLMKKAVRAAWKHGYLADSRDMHDYRLTSLNFGWEVPGTVNAAMKIKDLSLQAIKRNLIETPKIKSSWDDLTEGIESPEQWQQKRIVLRKRFLQLLRDEHKPPRVPLDLQEHESVVVDNKYVRKLISYQVEADERAHAYLGVPLKLKEKAAGIVALHGTFEKGKERVAGLVDNPDKAYLDHLCRRGYVVIAPDHFVAGNRTPQKGAYDTTAFYEKHPEWTAAGKATWEHSIAVDVLLELEEVDAERVGTLGHSLGGQGAIFLAAYDERIKVAASNCSAPPFRHNPKVLSWARDHWYSYFKHTREGILKGELPPIDFHEIMALISPRAFLDVSALNDGKLATQQQRALLLMSVMDVYQLDGVPENFGFYIHGRGHSIGYESRQLIYGWMDRRLLPPESTAAKLVSPQ